MIRSTTFTVALGLLLGLNPRQAEAQPRAAACCTVLAVDAARGVVSARVTASGYVFEFKARTPSAVASLRAGQSVHANFAKSQVSLDGRTVCCTVTRAPAPAVAVRQPAPAPAKAAAGAGAAIPVTTAARAINLPQVSYGEPMQVARTLQAPAMTRRATRRSVSARVAGRTLNAQVLHLNGRQAIAASGLPDGARRLLEMHVRKLPLDESQYYLVNPQLAAQWAATHPVPPEVKPKQANDNNSDCGTVSINGVVDCAEDAAQAVEQEFERARKQADDWWTESTDELAKQWNEAKGCFADHTLPGPRTPVKFSIAPSMSVNMTQSGSKGSAQGTLSGTVGLGIPMQADFQAKMEFFYIPCLPFVFRPKGLTADGSLTVGQQLTVDVSASGAFHKIFTIPPTGGPQIPLYVIPIVIGDVPVAVLDISAYIEGEVEVNGKGSATGRFAVSNSHRSTFEFTCSGSGCKGQEKGSAAPTTTNESAQIEGQVSVQPGLYTALQLSFDYNVLQGRAGPQPYLLGIANGCGAVSATQTGAASSSQSNLALTADLDWGAKLRAEALAGGQRIGDRWETPLMRDRHLWFRDLATGGSSALVAAVNGPSQAVAAQAASVKVRMPSCYPYSDNVEYRLTWTGSALPAPNAACSWQSGSGTCSVDPAKELTLSLTWPNAGAYTVAVQLVRDTHRVFVPAPQPALLNVNVSGQ